MMQQREISQFNIVVMRACMQETLVFDAFQAERDFFVDFGVSLGKQLVGSRSADAFC
jgi:hypothetical protein